MRSFAKTKPLRNFENTLYFTNASKSYKSREFLTWQTCFNAIRENKILAKIFLFTVIICCCLICVRVSFSLGALAFPGHIYLLMLPIMYKYTSEPWQRILTPTIV